MKLPPRSLSFLLFGALLSWAWQSTPPSITRGPYLQNASASGITLVCKTSSASALTLRFGESSGPPWTHERTSASGTTHVFALSGLRPETSYRYEILAGTSSLAGGDDCVFRTSPPSNSRSAFRFVAWGDSGTGSSSQLAVARRMEEALPRPDFALGLGDLVYDDGEWENYDPKLFGPYETLFKHATFWPTIGNHDARTENGAPYVDAFYLPTQTGAPGQPSNSERYYSFDHGMAHFTCLDSETTSLSPGSTQFRWAEADIDHARARGKRWLFVYMHHPPYSRGTHDSTREGELIDLHDELVPMLESKGVDMVLVGHSHVYERSFLVDDDRVLQPHASEYTKYGSPDGTIYLVNGCGGKSGSGELDLAVMARSYGDVTGYNALDVSWAEVRGRFIEGDGATTDLFVLRKNRDRKRPRVTALEARSNDEVAIVFNEPVLDGSGASGAENLANYSLTPSGSVTSATLDDDQSTVLLRTTPLVEDRAYSLDVFGVRDPVGRLAFDRYPFALASGTSGGGQGGTPVVPQGATWRYLKGTTNPGSGWAAPGFSDSSWPQGPAGFGFADGDDATVLSDMDDGYSSVYARARFAVADPAQATAMTLRVSFDDGFVAFLNGTEIARQNVPSGQTNTTLATTSHEADSFEAFDVSSRRNLLVAGTNVLAVVGYNQSLSSSDFSLHPELLLELGGGGSSGGAPRAVLSAPVRSSIVPARLRFSALGSTPGATLSWDFGDGTPRGSGAAVEHVYTRTGNFLVSLVARDAAGKESVAQTRVKVHNFGLAPRADLTASAVQITRGQSVSFGSVNPSDPDGGPVTLHWDFGDPESGTANVASTPSASHAYSRPGTYVATLVVTDDEGTGASEWVTIVVN